MGIMVAEDIAGMPNGNNRQALPASPAPQLPGGSDISEVMVQVSRHLGLLRDGDGLRLAIMALLPLSQGQRANAAIVGLMMAVAAHRREESRGAHARTDFPSQSSVARRHFLTLDEAFSYAKSLTSQSDIIVPFARSA